ncbi:MAG: LytR C-terminal domain-containing protein [Acidimicrobiales bacterium]|nr:LytR C-terminal domain-containing protein [Acidimicrobiales bacterium]
MGTNAARGIAVILAAVAVGAVLMWLGYSNDSVDATAGDDGSALVSDDDGSGDDGSGDDGSGNDGSGDDGSGDTSSTTETTTTTTTTPPSTARPAAEVTVVVMNATEGKPGIAGRSSAIAEQAGYTMLEAGNAQVDQDTAIQYAPDYEADAVAVAEAFGLDESVVEPFPDELNIRDEADVAGANIIVFVGLDGLIDP